MMAVEQITESVVNERLIDIYFAPDYVNNSRPSCFEMEFTAFRPFRVLLASIDDKSVYHEKEIYRILTPLDKELRVWRTNIRPEATNGQRFYIIIRMASKEAGELAVIKRTSLTQRNCPMNGMCEKIFLHSYHEQHIRAASCRSCLESHWDTSTSTSRGAKSRVAIELKIQTAAPSVLKHVFPCKEVLFAVLLILYHFGSF